MATQTADVVVIGGGIMGAATAYFLTKGKAGKVILVEKGALAAGATGKSAALIRQHYSNAVTVLLTKRSIEIFERYPEELGAPGVFRQTGWTIIVPAEQLETFRTNLALERRLGVDVREIAPSDLPRHLPGLNPDGVAGAAYEPKSGYADPQATVRALGAGARKLGAEVRLSTEVTGIEVAGGRVRGVQTTQGPIAAPVVVNCGGPWADRIARMVGVEFPLELSREQEVWFQLPPAFGNLPMPLANPCDQFYCRPEGPGLLLGVGHPKENEPCDPDDYADRADVQFIEDVSRRLVRRFPALAEARVVRGWAGVYAITPDWNPAVGPIPEIAGLYIAAGGSGHGFKLGLGLGEALAQLVLTGRSDIDLWPLRFTRFREGSPLPSSYKGGGNRA